MRLVPYDDPPSQILELQILPAARYHGDGLSRSMITQSRRMLALPKSRHLCRLLQATGELAP